MNFLLGNKSSSSSSNKPRKNFSECNYYEIISKNGNLALLPNNGNLKLAVGLPRGGDINEWMAINTFAFFNQINLFYDTLSEFCTEQTCQVMSAGPKYEFPWTDGQTIKKPIKCSAPRYIDYSMNWMQTQFDNESIFPSAIGVAFPKTFLQIVKTILKCLFYIYAHIYHEHFNQIMVLKEESHLNTSFKHFILFIQEFNLIEKKELVPMQELIDKLA